MLTVCLQILEGVFHHRIMYYPLSADSRILFFFYKIFLSRTNQLQTFRKSTRDTDGADVSLISWLAIADKICWQQTAFHQGK